MDLLPPPVERYLHDLAHAGDPVLDEMERLAAERRFPIVGPQVGRLLELLARSIGAERVLELGSGFGYSAAWFSRAVGENGLVLLTEGSEERCAEARRFLERCGFSGRTRVETGDAFEIASRIGGTWDVVFNDVDKQDYGRVLDVARERLRPGGWLLSDNMLWSGRVAAPDPADTDTAGILELTRRLYDADDFATALLPLRDGVTVSIRLR